MSGRVVIDFRPEEGAVPRIVGLVERRGFALRGMTMVGSALTLELEGRDPSRRLELLDRQLRRIDGVSNVAIFTPPVSALP